MGKVKSIGIILLIMVLATGCGKTSDNKVDYSDKDMWVYQQTDVTDKYADVFFICPTVYSGAEDTYNMPLDDEEARASFLGAVNMELGIYDADCRVFAPYYSQVGLNVCLMEVDDREQYLERAYEDIEAAFKYYMENFNEGRPLILAGFSQGSDMIFRLYKNYLDEEFVNTQLIATYAIGWHVTQDDLDNYPQMVMAQGEDDTGVIITYNSEAEDIDDSFTIPNGMKTFSINPLNWKTDGTPADKSLNLGSCFTNADGEIVSEISNLTGAYIDEERGSLKVTDISPEDYPPGAVIFDEGVYHVYDYQFFYRNLQENVKVRTEAYKLKN